MCKSCRTYFIPQRKHQKVCGAECARAYASTDKAKEELWKERKKELEEELRPKSYYEKKLEDEINAIVRLLDDAHGCISCGSTKSSQAGHYHSKGGNCTIRFNLFNIWRQCYKCNVQLSANIIGYDEGLIDTFSEDVWRTIKFDLVRKYPLLNLSIPEIKSRTKKAREIKKRLEKDPEQYSNSHRLAMRRKLNKELGIY